MDVFSDKAIIPPPVHQKYRDLPTRAYRVFIDSKDRDRTVHPDPSNYTINLLEELHDVVSVELISYHIPFSDFNITKDNNILHVRYEQDPLKSNDPETTTVYELEIPPGKYSLTDPSSETDDSDLSNSLIRVLRVLFDNKFELISTFEGSFVSPTTDSESYILENRNPHIPLTVTYLKASRKILFTNHYCLTRGQNRNPLTLVFGSNGKYLDRSIGKTLGFEPKEYVMNVNPDEDTYDIPPQQSVAPIIGDGVPYSALSTYMIDLRTDPYIALKLDGVKNEQTTNHRTHDSFAIIPYSTDDSGSHVLNHTIKKHLPIPIHSMNKLNIKMLTPKGELYDFHNKDHQLQLCFTCFKQTRDYGAIWTEH
jgi:hypothetical protein